jgi:hypothetical protein
MANQLDDSGVLYLLTRLFALFVRKETGKGLSTNDLTDELKALILGQFSGSWNDLTNKPVNVYHWVSVARARVNECEHKFTQQFTADAAYQSAQQVASAISSALQASGYQTAAQVEAALGGAIYTRPQTDALLRDKANAFTPRTSGVFQGCSTLEQLVQRLESIFNGNTQITGINVS